MAIDFKYYIDSKGIHWIANSDKDENGAYKGGAERL